VKGVGENREIGGEIKNGENGVEVGGWSIWGVPMCGYVGGSG